MRRTMIVLTVMGAMILLFAGGAFTQEAPKGQHPHGQPPEHYIVVLKDEVDHPGEVASTMAQRHNLRIGFVYQYALKGFSAIIPNDRVAAVRSEGRVDYIERDETMHAVTQTIPWGITKIGADLSTTKAGDGTGTISNVNAYIIDSGIDASHPELNVVKNRNFTGDGTNTDCNGHGTHVAGSVAAKDNDTDVVGVAPGAPLTGVKVLGCGGAGAWSTIIKGIEWVTANAQKPAVANMSLGGGASQSVDDAVRNSAASGIFYSIAAGNNGQPACNYSPARAGLARSDTNNDGIINHEDANCIVTTAATDSSDQEASFSNYGKCVDVWAPGVSILSTKMGGGTTTMSGTSMAAPHVGGGGGLYLSANASATPIDVEKMLKSTAKTPGTISKAPGGARYVTLEYVGGF